MTCRHVEINCGLLIQNYGVPIQSFVHPIHGRGLPHGTSSRREANVRATHVKLRPFDSELWNSDSDVRASDSQTPFTTLPQRSLPPVH